ncbi:ATP-binding cassette domain-containing protein [Halalkalibacter sp. APA_J-10(15)]|uniref:ATP-binding cassette domain-containing protein n=1 Tax=Halalkalibacter sp. APA_J-10(15) TaxID=2933805 RepID=UPI001FF3339E|nr:ABC transporter ATP-binding protein [Halalkalibacter sp. APA_J-10(15)]MCK0473011.1 ABC transporter ATP-binding protein [Halalkalibacter sp. APA_J-10(15)]
MSVIFCENVSQTFQKTEALRGLSFTIQQNSITGIIGRNGAGKTTLLKLLAGFTKPKAGEIKVFSEHPFDSLTVSANSIFVDDQMSFPSSLNLKEILQFAAHFYPNWDQELAERLFDYFQFQPKQGHQKLSKGKRSTFNAIIGLCARCPLTIFDEPTTGMDAAVRSDFYRALMKEYLAYPRTILLSSHHIEEIEELLEDVLLIHEGKKLMHIPVDQLSEMAVRLSGSKDAVEKWMNNKKVYDRKMVGTDQVYIAVENDFTDDERTQLKRDGLDVVNVSANDMCVYVTKTTEGGIDDVFRER